MKKRFVTSEEGCVYEARPTPEDLELNRLRRDRQVLRRAISTALNDGSAWASSTYALLTEALYKTATPKRRKSK